MFRRHRKKPATPADPVTPAEKPATPETPQEDTEDSTDEQTDKKTRLNRALSMTGFTHSDLLHWQIDYAGGSLNVNGTIMRDTYSMNILMGMGDKCFNLSVVYWLTVRLRKAEIQIFITENLNFDCLT